MNKINRMSDIDKISEAVSNLQKCLECTICLELMTAPVKSRCGHSFCQSCIEKVVIKKNAQCPLCKASIQRRSVSKDDHLETCIQKFQKLVTAVKADCNIDILSHRKQPHNTREGCSNSPVNQSSDFNTKKERFNQSAPKIDRLSRTRRNLIARDLSNDCLATTEKSNDAIVEQKIRTWLHSWPSEPDIVAEEENKQSNENKATVVSDDQNKSSMTHTTLKGKIGNRKTSKIEKQIIKTRQSTKADNQTQQTATAHLSDSSTSCSINISTLNNKQPFVDMSQSRIEFGKEIGTEKKQRKRSTSITEEETESIENSAPTLFPLIAKKIKLTTDDKYDSFTNATDHNTSNKRNNVSNVVKISNSHKQDAIVKSPNSSNIEIPSTNPSDEWNNQRMRELSTQDNIEVSTSNTMMEISHIRLKEGNVPIKSLNNQQLSEILGFEDVKENCPLPICTDMDKNRYSKELPTEYRNSSSLLQEELTTLQSEKLHQHEHKIIRNITPTNDLENLTCLTHKNRTPEPQTDNNNVKNVSEIVTVPQSRSSTSTRLSLRKSTDSNKSIDSPVLDNPAMPIRSFDKYNLEKDVDNCKNFKSSFNRLSTVKRDLSLQIINTDQSKPDQATANISFKEEIEIEDNNENDSRNIYEDNSFVRNNTTGSTRSKTSTNTKKQIQKALKSKFIVPFKQMGTLIRRRKVKYLYMSAIKREQSMPMKIQANSVYNMQLEKGNSEEILYNLPSLQDSVDVVENVHLTDNLDKNQSIVSTSIEISSARATYNVPTSSRQDLHHHPNLNKVIENPSTAEDQRLNESIGNVEENIFCKDRSTTRKETLHARPRIISSIKLLSPDKDSQLRFLAIDSPMSQQHESKRTNSRHKTSTQGLLSGSSEFVPQFKSTKKRKRCVNKLFSSESFDGKNDESNDSTSDNDQYTIKSHKYLEKSFNNNEKIPSMKSSSSEKKKRRLYTPPDQSIDVDQFDYKKQHKREKKFKRIILVSSSDTESESSAHIHKKRNQDEEEYDNDKILITDTPNRKQDLDENTRMQKIINKWHDEHNAMQKGKALIRESKNVQLNIKLAHPSEEETMSHSSHLATNAKHKSTKASCATMESDLFGSSSVFNMVNIDNIVSQSIRASKKEVSKVDDFNDDIINKVLEVDRSHNNLDLQKNDISQRDKNDTKQHLLQDNLDEIICNVELPQNEDVILCTSRSDHNLDFTLIDGKTSKCLDTEDEFGDTVHETSAIIPLTSSIDDDIDNCNYQSARNITKLASSTERLTSSSSEKKTSSSINSKKKHDHLKNKIDRKNITSINTIDFGDNCENVTLKDNISHKKETSVGNIELNKRQIDKESNVSSKRTDKIDKDIRGKIKSDPDESNLKDSSLEIDTLMNVTQHQLHLQMFEEDLFGITAARDQVKTTRMTLQDNPFQAEQHTPRNRKRDAHNEKVALEEDSSEEDNVVENTPETRRKNKSRNITMSHLASTSRFVVHTPDIHPKKIPQSGPNTPMKPSKVKPLCQSTPKPATNLVTNKCLDASVESKNLNTTNDRVSPTTNKTLEDTRRNSDNRKLRFTWSGMTPEEVAKIKQFAQMHNAEYTNQFDTNVTHVILRTTGDANGTKNTLKYLQGIAHRKWLVGYKWIEDCIKEQKLLDEVPYEATTRNYDVYEAGPRKSRLRDKDLFEGFTFLCIGPFDNVSVNQYKDLLLATGATVVDSLEALAKEQTGLKGVVIQGNDCNVKEIEHWYRTARAATIITDWIVECISQYKLVLLLPFVQYLSVQSLCTIGYPLEMIGDEDSYPHM